MATKDWNGFKKSGDTFIPNDATARANITAIKDGTNIDSFGDVETALAGKADKFGVDGLTIDWLQGVGIPDKLYVMEHDEIPQEGTESSGLPSDTAIRKAVKSAYNLMEDTVGWSGKNLYDLVATSKTDQYGGIWTVNDDKTITVSGTPTNYEPFSTRSYKVLPVGSYILSWDNTNVVNASIDTIRLYKDNTQVRKIPIPNALLPVAFNITVEDDYDRINVAFKRYTNNEPMSGTIKPMIRKSTILDDTYEPYRGTTAFPRDEQAVLGAKNLLVYPYKGSKNENGVIFTNNEDGTINVNGTATSYSDYSFHNRTADPLNLPAGKYYISGGISSAINIVVGRTYNGSFQELAVSTGTDAEFTVTEGDNLGISLRVNQNAEANNITIKPMIRLATDTDDTYVPYAMTNRELTDAVTSRTVAITTDANTLTKEGTYLYTSLITDAPTIHLPSEITNRYARIEVKTINGTSQLTQVLYTHNKTDFWTRALNNGTFTNWFKFSGTEVTP